LAPVPPKLTARVPDETLEALKPVSAEALPEVDPVPPEATGSAEPSVSDVRWVTISTTLIALVKTHVVLPAGTVMPVPAVVLTTTASPQVLLTI
jgi:hypothetical protein